MVSVPKRKKKFIAPELWGKEAQKLIKCRLGLHNDWEIFFHLLGQSKKRKQKSINFFLVPVVFFTCMKKAKISNKQETERKKIWGKEGI